MAGRKGGRGVVRAGHQGEGAHADLVEVGAAPRARPSVEGGGLPVGSRTAAEGIQLGPPFMWISGIQWQISGIQWKGVGAPTPPPHPSRKEKLGWVSRSGGSGVRGSICQTLLGSTLELHCSRPLQQSQQWFTLTQRSRVLPGGMDYRRKVAHSYLASRVRNPAGEEGSTAVVHMGEGMASRARRSGSDLLKLAVCVSFCR